MSLPQHIVTEGEEKKDKIISDRTEFDSIIEGILESQGLPEITRRIIRKGVFNSLFRQKKLGKSTVSDITQTTEEQIDKLKKT
jgi:hypothetical protein